MDRRALLRRGIAVACAGAFPGCGGGDGTPAAGTGRSRTVGGTSPGDERRRPDGTRTADGTERGCRGADRYCNPVLEWVFPDPAAVRTPDGRYVAYGTYHDWGEGPDRGLLPVAASADLVDWRVVGAVFDEQPDWTRYAGLWAPDVERFRGRYLLYYSDAEFGAVDPGIGVATAEDPEGPFTDRGPVLRSLGVGVPNAIDPCLFVEERTPHLFFGSHAGIYGVRLSADGLALDGETFQVAGPGVEAAYVVRRGGRYYLFGSRGTCCDGPDSTYRVVVGRADSLAGPYRNRAGESLLAADATGTTVVRGGPAFAAPGHNAVVRDGAGTDWTLQHAYERGNWWVGDAPRRVPVLSRLRWTHGWPVVPGRTPGRSWPRPTA